MFEGLVVAILNKFLKPYVKNLDSSQLKLSVFSGDVTLKELEVKPDALADLNLPIRIRSGFLQDLTLKIPWRSLYTSRTVVAVRGLYLLVSPATSFKYDKEKAEKEAKERKKEQLEQIEEKKRQEQEGSTKDEKSAGFAEKLVTQIVKNLELTIENIHVRYEDDVSDPDHPFSFGVTLEEVSARTTDSNYTEKVIKESVERIYKLLQLKCLSVYWNSDTKQLAGLPLNEWKKSFFDGIARVGQSHPEEYQYVLAPLTSSAKLMLNQKPGTDMNIPRVLLDFVLEQIGFHLSRRQFVQIMHLIEGFDMMALNLKYLKYKAPGRPKGKKNVSLWWKYAFNAVLKEDVQRRFKMWSWKHIKKYRLSLKSYRALYLKKLLGKAYDKTQLESLEDHLDVFSITFARGLAEAEERKLKKEQEAEKAERAKEGFFSRWFGSTKKTDKGTVAVAQVAGETVEIPESEKKKLYDAIGYSDDAAIASFPEEYVELRLKFKLVFLVASVEGEDGSPILNAKLDGAMTEVEMRPSAKGLSVHASSSTFSVYGMEVDGLVPALLTPQLTDPSQSLVSVDFDVNPLNQPRKIDQKLRVALQPSEITVDMPTINALIAFFQLPSDVHLQKVSSAAQNQLSNLRESGRASIQHAIGQRNLFDLAIHVQSPYVILPENGRLTESASVVVVDLGKFSMKSELQDEISPERATQEELDQHAYDKFSLDMTDFSVCLAPSKSKWEESRHLPTSPLHVIQPLGLKVTLMKSIIPDDVRLATIKVGATLPSIEVALSDKKIENIMKIVDSLPLPELEKPHEEPVVSRTPAELPSLSKLGVSASKLDLVSLDSVSTIDLEQLLDEPREGDVAEENVFVEEKKADQKNVIQFVGDFVIEKIAAVMSEHKNGKDTPVCDFSLKSVKSSVKVSTWDMTVNASVGPLALRNRCTKDEPLEMLSCSPDAQLLTVNFTKADPSSPEFETVHCSTLHKLTATVSSLDVTAEERSLHRLIDFFVGIIPQESTKAKLIEAADENAENLVKSAQKASSLPLTSQSKTYTQFAVEASLEKFGVVIMSDDKNLGELHIQDVKTDVILKTDVIDVDVRMKDFFVLDGAEDTKYKKIVQIVEGSNELFKAHIRIFNRTEDEKETMDLDCADVEVNVVAAALRIVFINDFVQAMMNFALGFKPSDEVIETAKQKAVEAASKARDKMKENVDSRIRLDVNLAAPCIVAPRSSASDERLEANLGRIIVANHFLHKESPTSTYKVLIDSLDVSLTQLELKRKGSSSGSDMVLIEPVELGVTVDRCLSARHEGLPMVSVKGKIPKIGIKGGKDDINFIFAFLDENMKVEETQAKAAEKRIQEKPSAKELAPKSPGPPVKKPTPGVEDAIADVNFELPEVSVTVLTQNETDCQPWLEFSINSVVASVHVGTDSAEVSASLRKTMLLDYTVKGKSGRPLKVISSSEEKDLICFHLNRVDRESPKFDSSEMKIALDVTSIAVNIHEETVNSALKFVETLALSKAPPPPPVSRDAADAVKSTPSSPSLSPPPEESSAFSQMTMNAKLDKLAILLISSQCRLADFSIDAPTVHLEMMSDGKMSVSAKIEDLVLLDARPSMENGITRILSRVVGSESKFLIEVNYTRSAQGENSVVAYVNDLHIVGAVEFSLNVVYFVKSLVVQDSVEKIKEAVPIAAAESMPVVEPPSTPIDVQVKIKNNKVFLLEDAKNEKTRVILAQFNGTGRFYQNETQQKAMLGIPDFTVYTCFYDKRATMSSEIVSPLSMQFTYALSYVKKTTRITVETPAVIASIGPHMVHIIRNIVNCATETWKELEPPAPVISSSTETCPSGIWDPKPVDKSKWYYQTDNLPQTRIEGKTAFDRQSSLLERQRKLRQTSSQSLVAATNVAVAEEILIEIEHLDIKLENESKGWFYPVIALNASAKAELTNWSTNLSLDASLDVEVSYFNERIAVWEPLLEPVPKSEFRYRRWRLGAIVKQHKIEKQKATPFAIPETIAEDEETDGNAVVKTSDSGVDLSARRESVAEVEMPPPAIAVTISSDDPLELTVTKTALYVIQRLVKTWTGTEENPDQLSTSKSLPPYLIENKTGQTITIIPGENFENEGNETGLKMTDGLSQPLRYKRDTRGSIDVLSRTFDADSENLYREATYHISIEVDGFKRISNVPVTKSCRLLYYLVPSSAKQPAGTVPLVCDIELVDVQKVVRIRSSFQIENNLSTEVDLYVKGESKPMTRLNPSETYSPPLLTASTSAFSISPTGSVYKPSGEFSWKSGKTSGGVRHSCVTCLSDAVDGTKFVARLIAEPETYDNVAEVPREIPHHTMHLYVPFVLHNQLPQTLKGQVEGLAEEFDLSSGAKESYSAIDVDSSEKGFTVYLWTKDDSGLEWNGHAVFKPHRDDELTDIEFTAQLPDGKSMAMMFGVRLHCMKSVEAYLFVPYWMVNKTGTALQYKADGASYSVSHESTVKNAVMFGLPKSGSKRKIRLKAFGSDWSKLFPLDAAGSGGSIKCKEGNQVYELGLQVTLTSFGLSRIVTFSSYQIVVNKTSETIFIYEGDSHVPVTIEPGQWEPYWAEGKSGVMSVKLGSNNGPESPKFAFNRAHSTLLELKGKPEGTRGVHVQVELSDSSLIISFTPYFVGSAPVRIENNIRNEKVTVNVFQKEEEKVQDTVVAVESGSLRMFTWHNPDGKRTLCWSFPELNAVKYQNNLKQDSHGKFDFPQRDGLVIYWASFLDGLQRVVMFTDDEDEMFQATETEHLEQADVELTVSIPSLGLSLVNDRRSLTVAYVSISSSGLMWEFKPAKKKRFRPESYEMCQKLEKVFVDASKAKESGLVVDFSKANDLKLIQPKTGSLRRTQHKGIWFQFSMSAHHYFMHGIVNRIQIDNQMKENVFPVVFNPVPPPKSVASQAAPKPFLEASVVINKTEQTKTLQIKYFMVLVQEMAVRVDMGLIGSLVDLFSPQGWDDSGEAERFKKDLEIIHKSILETSAVKATYEGQRIYISYLHLSPIKIHASFSMDAPGADEDESSSLVALPVDFVKVLLKSVGVVLTDVQDIELRLAYFELVGQSWTQQQLIGGIRKHYTTQAIKQMYALVLGLDVIGNPFGLVSDIKDGVFDLFYEPYQGAIQGPGEFAVGVAYGVQSLVSHTVGGLFGAVSRVTGTLGKGLTNLTFDDELKKEKAQANKPKGVKEGFTKGAQGLFHGIVGGIAGVVLKPAEGAKKGGVGGFFKGIGKGLIGVVARPVGGVVDFATSTFQGISSAADLETAVIPRRPARFIAQNDIIHPYCFHSALGNGMLQIVDGGKFASDEYFAHTVILQNPKIVFLLTNKHLIFIKEGEFLDSGEQKSAFSTSLSEILEVHEKDNNAIIVVLKTIKKSFFGKSEGNEKKGFKAPNKTDRQYALEKAHQAIRLFVH